MRTDRCPGCGAAVSPSAPWCTLCYTDLRPREPESVPQPVSVAAAAPGPVATPGVTVTTPAQPLPPDPILDAPVVVAAPVAGGAAAFWPCAGCGSRVPIADDVCSSCGASFLPTDGTPSLSLPGVGNMAQLDKGQRVAVVIGLAVAAMVVLLGLAFLLGSVL